ELDDLRWRQVLLQVELHLAHAAMNSHLLPEAASRQQTDAASLELGDRVGDDGRPVDDALGLGEEGRQREIELRGRALERGEDAVRVVRRRRQRLVADETALVERDDDVREGAPDVDADAGDADPLGQSLRAWR